MNAPFFDQNIRGHSAVLRVFALFHLNLAFSSIEEERRAEVIARCYWPLLRLAEKYPHIGLEVSGYTLEQIALLDPAWGGVYQYSTGGDFEHPHYEKLTTLQGEYLRVYALAYATTGDERWLRELSD